MILLNVETACFPRRGSMPRSLKVMFEKASNRWIRYWPSSYLSDSASFEWPMNDSIMASALLEVTVRMQPSSLTLNFSKVIATASLTLSTESSRSSCSMGNANPKISRARFERAKLANKIAACSRTSQFWCLRRVAAIYRRS